MRIKTKSKNKAPNIIITDWKHSISIKGVLFRELSFAQSIVSSMIEFTRSICANNKAEIKISMVAITFLLFFPSLYKFSNSVIHAVLISEKEAEAIIKN